jgi:hypothetical protein
VTVLQPVESQVSARITPFASRERLDGRATGSITAKKADARRRGAREGAELGQRTTVKAVVLDALAEVAGGRSSLSRAATKAA